MAVAEPHLKVQLNPHGKKSTVGFNKPPATYQFRQSKLKRSQESRSSGREREREREGNSRAAGRGRTECGQSRRIYFPPPYIYIDLMHCSMHSNIINRPIPLWPLLTRKMRIVIQRSHTHTHNYLMERIQWINNSFETNIHNNDHNISKNITDSFLESSDPYT